MNSDVPEWPRTTIRFIQSQCCTPLTVAIPRYTECCGPSRICIQRARDVATSECMVSALFISNNHKRFIVINITYITFIAMINARVRIISGYYWSRNHVRIIGRHIADNRSDRLFFLITHAGMLWVLKRAY